MFSIDGGGPLFKLNVRRGSAIKGSDLEYMLLEEVHEMMTTDELAVRIQHLWLQRVADMATSPHWLAGLDEHAWYVKLFTQDNTPLKSGRTLRDCAKEAKQPFWGDYATSQEFEHGGVIARLVVRTSSEPRAAPAEPPIGLTLANVHVISNDALTIEHSGSTEQRVRVRLITPNGARTRHTTDSTWFADVLSPGVRLTVRMGATSREDPEESPVSDDDDLEIIGPRVGTRTVTGPHGDQAEFGHFDTRGCDINWVTRGLLIQCTLLAEDSTITREVACVKVDVSGGRPYRLIVTRVE